MSRDEMQTRTMVLALVIRILNAIGIRRTDDGYFLSRSGESLAESLVTVAGRTIVVSLLGFLFVLNLWAIFKFPYFSPLSLVEESADTYTAAHNYLTYGFLHSGLLQDFSNSSKPADHPYVYDHFPPGPDILTALALKLSAGSYQASRVVFAVLFLMGIIVYLKFANQVLGRLKLPGTAAYTLLFLGPWMLVQNQDRQVASGQPLLMFGPLVALDAYYRRQQRWYLYLAMGVAFLSSFYLADTLVATVFCWLLLYETQLVRIDRKHLLGYCGIVGCGVTLHLLQNLLYLGPSTFFRELGMLLGNRILGSPPQQALDGFYHSIGLVNFGKHSLQINTVVFQIQIGRAPV